MFDIVGFKIFRWIGNVKRNLFLILFLLAPFVVAGSGGFNKEGDGIKNHRMFNNMPYSLNMRTEEENKNFVLAYSSKKLESPHEFSSHYKKENELYGWVIIYENDSELERIKKNIDDNLVSFSKIIKGINFDPVTPVSVRTFGTYGKTFNMMVNDLCGFNFKISIPEELNEITVSSRRDISNLDLCKSYPVILGASGISMEPDGRGGLILENYEELRVAH
jgi:hypothetical protein